MRAALRVAAPVIKVCVDGEQFLVCGKLLCDSKSVKCLYYSPWVSRRSTVIGMMRLYLESPHACSGLQINRMAFFRCVCVCVCVPYLDGRWTRKGTAIPPLTLCISVFGCLFLSLIFWSLSNCGLELCRTRLLQLSSALAWGNEALKKQLCIVKRWSS